MRVDLAGTSLPRALYANKVLATAGWPSWWSRDDQIQAFAEGWSLTVFDTYTSSDGSVLTETPRIRVNDTGASLQSILAHIVQRAEEGSELHQRALTLHTATVLIYGEKNGQSS